MRHLIQRRRRNTRAFWPCVQESFMDNHKFKVGELVEFHPGGSYLAKTRGQYEVVRLLPSEGDGYQYRVKNTTDGHERIVREGQID
tara:strand:+ start:1164 stop:1421 length:258 start_codon:yes stop_codon:yes gene_type:complete